MPGVSATVANVGGVPPPPLLDTRTADDIYAACLAAARVALPEWAAGFGAAPDWFDRADPGLALFKLFAELMHKLADGLNGVPEKYRLAFWDFMGVALRPPAAAEAPLSFTVTGKRAIAVPAGARVIGPSIPGIIFETNAELEVLPFRVDAAIAVQPAADAYVDLSTRTRDGGPFRPFGRDPAEQRFDHALLLGDSGLAFAGLSGTLTISLEGANLLPRYFARWSNSQGTALNPELTASGYDTLSFTFADLPDLPPGPIDGDTAPWLAVAPAEDVLVTAIGERVLPGIFSIALAVTLDAVAPDAAMANAAPVDLKRGGRPFGSTPAPLDAFYISSSSAFARPQAQISLDFIVHPVDPPGIVTLAWEYWQGGAWAPLAVTDGTANLTRSGSVTFACPQIERTSVNNTPGAWIRARIVAGGYGAPAGLVITEPVQQVVDQVLAPFLSDVTGALRALRADELNFGYTFRPASFAPPFIESLQIGCRWVARPAKASTRNGFATDPLVRAPYRPPVESDPTFYLGLASDAYDTAIAGRPLTLFMVPAPGSGATVGWQFSTDGTAVEYLSADGWRPLPPIQSAVAQADGIAIFRSPADFPATALFGRTLRWLRVVSHPGDGLDQLALAGIHTNVVGAVNAVSQSEIVLGSSTGEPDQSFAFPQRPILADAVVQVLEPTPVLFSGDDADLAALVQGGAGDEADMKQMWVTWKEVSNLDFSTPSSRHYLLDHDTGALGFGDGVRGRVPIQGRRNIRATYRYGGGTAGNVAAGTLTMLQRAIPGVGGAVNVMAAMGGLGADTVADLAIRAPADVAGQGRAVTLADFADVAVLASQDVARATCQETGDGRLLLSILPCYAGQTPTPGFDLVNLVQTFVGARALPLTAALLVVDGPDYRPVDVSVTVLLAQGVGLAAAQQALTATVAAFLHPLTGNAGGSGWTFGARLTASALAVALGGVAEVVAVDGLTLDADLDAVQLLPAQLPSPGQLSVTMAV